MRSESTSALGQPSETNPTLGGAVTRTGMRRWRDSGRRRSTSKGPGDKRAAILAKAHPPAPSRLPGTRLRGRARFCLLLHVELEPLFRVASSRVRDLDRHGVRARRQRGARSLDAPLGDRGGLAYAIGDVEPDHSVTDAKRFQYDRRARAGRETHRAIDR